MSLILAVMLAVLAATETTTPQPPHEWARGAVLYESAEEPAALVAKLDALKKLGVDGVVLKTSDKKVVDAAHKRGLKVIVDGDAWPAQDVDGLRVRGEAAQPKKPSSILIGAKDADTATLAGAFAQFPANQNYPLAVGLAEALDKADSRKAVKTIEEMLDTYPVEAIDVPFVGTTTQPRMAAAILLTMRGMPILQNVDDPQTAKWMALRKRSRPLSKGGLAPLPTSAFILGYVRAIDGDAVLVLHNLSDSEKTIPLAVAAAELVPLLLDEGVGTPETTTGTWRVKLAPRSSGVWAMR